MRASDTKHLGIYSRFQLTILLETRFGLITYIWMMQWFFIRSGILPYLQANNLAYSFVDAGRWHETPRSEIINFLTAQQACCQVPRGWWGEIQLAAAQAGSLHCSPETLREDNHTSTVSLLFDFVKTKTLRNGLGKEWSVTCIPAISCKNGHGSSVLILDHLFQLTSISVRTSWIICLKSIFLDFTQRYFDEL